MVAAEVVAWSRQKRRNHQYSTLIYRLVDLDSDGDGSTADTDGSQPTVSQQSTVPVSIPVQNDLGQHAVQSERATAVQARSARGEIQLLSHTHFVLAERALRTRTYDWFNPDRTSDPAPGHTANQSRQI